MECVTDDIFDDCRHSKASMVAPISLTSCKSLGSLVLQLSSSLLYQPTIYRGFQGQHHRGRAHGTTDDDWNTHRARHLLSEMQNPGRMEICELRPVPSSASFRYSLPLTIGQDKAYNDQQAYKEGKFILERAMIQDVQ
jgi:hypothetical protein